MRILIACLCLVAAAAFTPAVTSRALRAVRKASSIEDAPDAEGQTISHWDEDAGSTRWALVEPSLAALKQERRRRRRRRPKDGGGLTEHEAWPCPISSSPPVLGEL